MSHVGGEVRDQLVEEVRPESVMGLVITVSEQLTGQQLELLLLLHVLVIDAARQGGLEEGDSSQGISGLLLVPANSPVSILTRIVN